MNDMGQSFVIEIDPQMNLEDIMALLEVEVWTSPHSMRHRSIANGQSV